MTKKQISELEEENARFAEEMRESIMPFEERTKAILEHEGICDEIRKGPKLRKSARNN